jgi:hypothetical protein
VKVGLSSVTLERRVVEEYIRIIRYYFVFIFGDGERHGGGDGFFLDI